MKNQAGILRKVGNVFPLSVKLKLCEMYSTFTAHLRFYFIWGIQFTEKQKNKVLICFFLQAKLQFAVLIRAAGLHSLPEIPREIRKRGWL